MTRTPVAPARPDAGAADQRRTWWSLLLFPVSFVAAFGVGEGLASALGHPTGSGDVPVWVMVAAGGPALVVFAVPAVLAVLFGRRALRRGATGAKVPMLLAVVVAALFVAQNLVAAVAQAL